MKNKKTLEYSKYLLNKSIYILEFIISIILSKQVLEIFINKYYYNFYPKLTMIFSVILSIIIIGIIIYICRTNKNSIEKIFISVAIPISIGYAIFVLPFNVPDEGTHILKAYDITQGNIFTKIDENGDSSCTVAKELDNYSYLRIQDYKTLFEELKKDTNYSEKIQKVSSAQGYSPILYIGTAIGIKLSEMFNLNIFLGIYFGRLLNIIIFLIFGYFSIKKIPFGKVILAVSLCMPMLLQQAASCSADAILNSTLIYYIVHLIYMTYKETDITKKDKIILYVLTALIAMFKYIYIILAGILFITIFNKKEKRKDNIKTIIILILIGSIFSIGWFIYSSKYHTIPEAFKDYYESANINSGKQLEYMKGNMLNFGITFIKEYLVYGADYIFQAVGSNLGWLNVNINMGIIVLYIIILMISAISEENKYQFSKTAKIWIILLVLAISAILNVFMYITFTPVGLKRICGVQGRYYTPILFLIFLCIIKKDNNWKIKNINEKMMIMSFILNIATLINIIIKYL